MKNPFPLSAHLLAAIAKLPGPGGRKTLITENLLLKRQLLIPGRSRPRAPNLSAPDRLLLGFGPFFLPPRRPGRAAIIVRPPTLLGFHRASSKMGAPGCLGSDHDPLFRYNQWRANPRIRGTGENKTVPHAPLSHPFSERLVGTIRRECLARILFWNRRDLEEKPEEFRVYYNAHRVHQALNLRTPEEAAGKGPPPPANLESFAWRSHCQGLFQTPVAA